MPGIFDAQSHFIPPKVAQATAFFKVGWSDIEKQLAVMDECQIEKSLLLYPTSDAHINMGGFKNLTTIYNQEISNVVKEYPSRFIGAGIVNVGSVLDLKDSLKQINDYGFKVISMASSYDTKYLDDEIFIALYEFAQENGTAIHIHPQIINPIGEERVKDPLLSPVLEYVFDVSVCLGKMMMSGVFLKYNKVKFIFAHYGGVIPFVKERFDTTYLMLRGRNIVKDIGKVPSEYFKNLYFDTSGSKSLASLLCMLEICDYKHILFGSDYPANKNVKESIDFMAKSNLTKEEQKAILRNNLFDLLKEQK